MIQDNLAAAERLYDPGAQIHQARLSAKAGQRRPGSQPARPRPRSQTAGPRARAADQGAATVTRAPQTAAAQGAATVNQAPAAAADEAAATASQAPATAAEGTHAAGAAAATGNDAAASGADAGASATDSVSGGTVRTVPETHLVPGKKEAPNVKVSAMELQSDWTSFTSEMLQTEFEASLKARQNDPRINMRESSEGVAFKNFRRASLRRLRRFQQKCSIIKVWRAVSKPPFDLDEGVEQYTFHSDNMVAFLKVEVSIKKYKEWRREDMKKTGGRSKGGE